MMSCSFQTDHYMAALSMLYRNIFRFPEQLSTRADLEYFRAGKFHLKRDLDKLALSEELGHLFDEILRSAQDLLKKVSSAKAM